MVFSGVADMDTEALVVALSQVDLASTGELVLLSARKKRSLVSKDLLTTQLRPHPSRPRRLTR